MHRVVVLWILLFSPSILPAQSVRGKLTVAGGIPAAGAIVTLVDRGDTVVARGLSSPLGSYSLAAPAAGEFRLRVLRVGFPAWKSPSFTLAAGAPAEFSVTLPEDAIVLAEIDVLGGGASCQVGAEEGSATATLLEEVAKAFGSAELALRDREFAFQIMYFAVESQPSGIRIRSDSVLRLLYTWPIRTHAPARLRDDGFVQRQSVAGLEMIPLEGSDNYTWFGPDAATLLSAPFLESHCFKVVPDRRDSTRVGLSFAPIRGRTKPDIDGTLWVDRRSLAVRSLSYEYVNAPAGFPRKVGNGAMDFLRLPNGLWLVSRWTIRAPKELQQGGRTVGVGGWLEEGGYIREIRKTDGELIYTAPPRSR